MLPKLRKTLGQETGRLGNPASERWYGKAVRARAGQKGWEATRMRRPVTIDGASCGAGEAATSTLRTRAPPHMVARPRLQRQ